MSVLSIAVERCMQKSFYVMNDWDAEWEKREKVVANNVSVMYLVQPCHTFSMKTTKMVL